MYILPLRQFGHFIFSMLESVLGLWAIMVFEKLIAKLPLMQAFYANFATSSA